MGASETKSPAGNDFQTYMNKFIDKGKHNDKLYGEGKLVQSKETKALMFVKEYTTNEENTFKMQMKRFEDRCRLKHPNLIELHGFTSQSEPQFCSTTYKTYLLFEYCSKNLEGEVTSRKLDSCKHFTIEEMWHILESYVFGLAFLQSRKLQHGDIGLSHLFIAPNSQFKVAEQGMLNANSSFAQMISNNGKGHKGVYLSPLLLKALETMNLRPKHNVFKSDVFSLGLCVIHAGLLESCDNIYNYNKFFINEMALEEKIEKLKILYPLEFVHVVQQMIQLDEKNRPDFASLEKLCQDQHRIFNEKNTQVQTFSTNQQVVREEFTQEQQPQQLYSSGNHYNYGPTTTYVVEEKVYKEPIIEKNVTFKQESPNYSPKFEANTVQKVIIESNNYNSNVYKYNDPFEIQPPQQTTYISYQKNEYEEAPKRSYNQMTSPEPKEISINRVTETTISPKTVEISASQENNYRSVADYPVNYDDINALLRKYGIEPLQPLQTTLQTTASPSKIYEHERLYQTHEKSEFTPAQPQQNYAQTVTFSQQTPNIDYQNYNNYNNYSNYEKPSVSANEEGYRYQNYAEILRNYDQKPAFLEEERKEGAKRHGFDSNYQEKSYVQASTEPISKQFQYEYKPYVVGNSGNFSSNLDFYSNYNKPSEIAYENNVMPAQYEKKPSLYDNVSFAHEFLEPKPQENPKHEDLKKKSSITEMKKSLNSSEVKEVVVENYQNGAKYEGEKLRGMRHGKGRFFYSDGGVYDGEWRENHMNGKGILYYGSGKIAYEGDWVDDKFEGSGVLYNETPVALNEMFDFRDFDNIDEFWIKYEGGFHNDNKEGYGVLFLTNGEKFVGYFKDDNLEGRGMFYKSNGELVSGMWRNNKLEEL